MKSSKVCIITRSPLASLLFKGLATKHTTVRWTDTHSTPGFSSWRVKQSKSRCHHVVMPLEQLLSVPSQSEPKATPYNTRSFAPALYFCYIAPGFFDPFINSSSCLTYNSHDVSLKNVVLDQLIIPLSIFHLFSSLVCLTLYQYCKEKWCLGHSYELKWVKGLMSLGNHNCEESKWITVANPYSRRVAFLTICGHHFSPENLKFYKTIFLSWELSFFSSPFTF